MGERLNLEIVENEKVLANSYYHWSGYTSSAIELTKIVLGDLKTTTGNSQFRAVMALEATGAGFTSEELDGLLKDNQDYSGFKVATSRNDGLLAVSEAGINETRRWAEGTVIVDIASLKVDFRAVRRYTEEEAEEHEIDPTDLAVIPESMDVSQLTIADLILFEEICKKSMEDKTYGFKTVNGEIYSLVE